jgi:hypothetical protein
MALVSSTTFFQANSDETIDSDPRIGIFFILMSCVVQGKRARHIFCLDDWIVANITYAV